MWQRFSATSTSTDSQPLREQRLTGRRWGFVPIRTRHTLLRALVATGFALAGGAPGAAQVAAAGEADLWPDSVPADTLSATEVKPAEKPGWRFVHLNEIETPFLTFRVGGAILADYADYIQNDASEQQFEMPHSDVKYRDTRFAFRGRIKTARPITYQAGLLFDTKTRKWLIRQTGFVVDVPEIWGNLWIGRSKEGMSLNRVMVGYDGWTNERFTFSDASIPLLADGIKWQGYNPKRELIWNLGVFDDWLSEGQSFSYYRRQVAGRLGWVRLDTDTAGTAIHIGIGARIGLPTADSLQLRGKPEANDAPYFVDTGKFGSTLAGQTGIEAYYRPGPWLFGTEYYVVRARFSGLRETPDPVDAPTDPVDNLGPSGARMSQGPSTQAQSAPDDDHVTYHGGDAAVAWLITGETRGYSTPEGRFGAVSPRRPVFQGGPGAWEAILRVSYVDLNSGPTRGGTFWRVTPMVNWHLSDNVRLELVYGYGSLARFETTGGTHFFQSRLQMQI